jgi:hypothetical protein
MVAGDALGIVGKQFVAVTVFHHTNAGKFLLLPLECGKCNIGVLVSCF